MAPNQKSRSACLWVGMGCAVALAIGAAAIGGLTFWGYQKAKEVKDPVARARSVGEILGTSELPEGYFPVISLKIPWVMHFAVLSDEEPIFEDSGVVTEASIEVRASKKEQHSFIYFKFLRKLDDAQDVEDFFEGRIDDASVLEDSNINVDIDEVIRRGAIQLTDLEALYVVTRARVEANGAESEGLTTLILFDCPEDELTRMGIWSGPEPLGLESGNLAGTTGDENELRAFLGHFSVCG